MENRLKLIRKANRLTQAEFAGRIGSKQQTITSYENSLRTPSNAVIVSICREFGINEEWLRTGEGEMEAPSDTSLRGQIRAIMKTESEFAVSVVASLASMPPEWWNAWATVVEHEYAKYKGLQDSEFAAQQAKLSQIIAIADQPIEDQS